MICISRLRGAFHCLLRFSLGLINLRRLLAAELERLGFPKLMDREVHDVLFPHSLGHSVGVDLHEPHFDSSAK